MPYAGHTESEAFAEDSIQTFALLIRSNAWGFRLPVNHLESR
jgi:hypothetical protein